jgi:hypothetical protein
MADAGPSWRQQQAAKKATMYEQSDEKAQVIVRSTSAMPGGFKRPGMTADRYRPHGDRTQPWRGQAWGLASAQASF